MHIECLPSSVPSFPLNVAVNSITPQTAVVSWDQLTGSRMGGSNGQLTIKSYILTYKREKEDWTQAKRISLDKNSLSAVLDNLKANTNYIVSVRGVNDLGEGIPAFSSVFSTLSLRKLFDTLVCVCVCVCMCVCVCVCARARARVCVHVCSIFALDVT